MKNLIVLFLFWTLPAYSHVAIQEDIIYLDQAFIPVWYHAHQGNLEQAVNANQILQVEWQSFKTKYELVTPMDQHWKDGFGKIDGWLYQANRDLEENNIKLAYIHLDHAKYEMINFKRRFGFQYFLDDLYDLHESIAWINEVILDEKLCLLEWGELEYIVDQTIQKWDSMSPITIPEHRMSITSFDGFKVEELSKMLMTQFSQFQKAIMDTADQCQVQEMTSPIEATALKIIACFGRFDISAFQSY